MSGPVLFLGRADSALLAHLRNVEDEVVARAADAPVTAGEVRALDPGFVVVHGYRLLLRPPVLDLVPGRIVNAHISLLPHNRGTDPNLWSILEDTPAGVTLHLVDEGLDTGPIVTQRAVTIGDDETLASAYALLQQAMAALFAETWPALRAGRFTATPQMGPGSLHTLADRAATEPLLTAGWDTRVGALRGVRRVR